ncbi:hypothetical protein NQZ79_g8520 [Umbelopsis isabellina]|nr:hypothetical protein NQZ79_g8520 [Umbelopsis isabellina]
MCVCPNGTEPKDIQRRKVDDLSSGSDSDYTKYWIDWFLNTKGNEYFCEVDEEYILDRFNLTGLNAEVQHYSQALDLITDNLVEEEFDEDMRDQVEKSARHLYGLIHARFVITSRGLAKMNLDDARAFFATTNHFCQWVLAMFLIAKRSNCIVQNARTSIVPKSSRHAAIDGAYYGTSFPHMLFQVYPNLMPQKSTERYIPRIFGFKVHEIAKVHRWQDQLKERLEDQTRQNLKEQHQ